MGISADMLEAMGNKASQQKMEGAMAPKLPQDQQNLEDVQDVEVVVNSSVPPAQGGGRRRRRHRNRSRRPSRRHHRKSRRQH